MNYEQAKKVNKIENLDSDMKIKNKVQNKRTTHNNYKITELVPLPQE